MKIAIGNDHGGYVLKQAIRPYLTALGIEMVDFGCQSTDVVRYPYYAALVCKAIQEKEVDRGILICSTGIGMAIAANKFKGIRASLVNTSYQAKMTRAHNDSNVLCFGGRCIGDLEAFDMLQIWLDTAYEGGRHDISLHLIEELEAVQFSGKTINWKDEVCKEK